MSSPSATTERSISYFRKLAESDQPAISAHLLRLTPGDRRMRFGTCLPDERVAAYVSRDPFGRAIRLGYLSSGAVRGFGELVVADCEGGKRFGEVGLSVESGFQDQGVGTELMSRLLTFARNRNVAQLRMLCLRGNRRMQRLASKFDAELIVHPDEVEGWVAAPWPNYVSLLEEVAHNNTAFCWLMFETFSPDKRDTMPSESS